MAPPEAEIVDEPRHLSEPGSVPSFAISDTEERSAECVPDADNLIIAIAAKEASVTHTEISAEQAAAEIDSGTIDIDLGLLVSLSLFLCVISVT